MESDFTIIRTKINKKSKSSNNIKKFKNKIHFKLLFLFSIILIIFFIFSNISNSNLFKQIKKNI